MNRGVSQKVERFFIQYPLKKLGKNEVLFRPGENPPGIIYLVSGQINEYDITKQGNEVVVNVFKPPAFFPMSWAINKTPNQYFFETTTEISYRQAPADKVVRFLKSNPEVLFDLLARVYSGTDGMLRRMALLMGGSARSRVLFEILIAAKRHGIKKPGGGTTVMLHEDELASRAGLSRETISRELGKMKGHKLIEVGRSGIIIRNIDELENELGQDL